MIQNFNDPVIVIKTYDLYKNFYQEIRQWPKPERYNLGAKCEGLVLEILPHFLAASRNINPRFNLLQANLKLQLLKLLCRLAWELNLMTAKKYQFLAKATIEIGKMLGGWLKTMK